MLYRHVAYIMLEQSRVANCRLEELLSNTPARRIENPTPKSYPSYDIERAETVRNALYQIRERLAGKTTGHISR